MRPLDTKMADNPRTLPILLTIPEASALLRLGRHTVERLRADGLIDTVNVGRCVRVTRASVEALPSRLANKK